MDTRHFELQDLLSQALIAVEADDRAAAERALRKASRASMPPDPNDDEDDD